VPVAFSTPTTPPAGSNLERSSFLGRSLSAVSIGER
jgi:hypothetical protein